MIECRYMQQICVIIAIYITKKNISWNQLSSKNVIFTKFCKRVNFRKFYTVAFRYLCFWLGRKWIKIFEIGTCICQYWNQKSNWQYVFHGEMWVVFRYCKQWLNEKDYIYNRKNLQELVSEKISMYSSLKKLEKWSIITSTFVWRKKKSIPKWNVK